VNKFTMSLAGLAVAISGILLFNYLGADSNAALPRDCDNNSIIYCGGITPETLAQRYNDNKPGDLDNIYSAYGLSSFDMNHAGTAAKMGEVHKDGRVTVGGVTVATDARSIGREYAAGSANKYIDGVKYFERAPSISFARESIVAYVFLDANGDFRAAVLTSCGNPVTAKKPVYKCDSLTKNKISRTKYDFTSTATAKDGATIASYNYDFGDGQKTTSGSATISHEYSKPGTYTVKMSVNISVYGTTKTVTGAQCETQVVVETPPPTPVYSCDQLTFDKISRLQYEFTGKATAEGGANITGYTIDYGDGNSEAIANPTAVKHTYDKDGTYAAKLSVNVKVNGTDKTVTSAACEVKVTVSPPEECKPGIPVGDERCTPCEVPGKEQYPKNSPMCVTTVTELPHTGPMDFVGGALGLGSLVAAGYYYFASRRGLMAELLKR
jgi:PKD repeat protein